MFEAFAKLHRRPVFLKASPSLNSCVSSVASIKRLCACTRQPPGSNTGIRLKLQCQEPVRSLTQPARDDFEQRHIRRMHPDPDEPAFVQDAPVPLSYLRHDHLAFFRDQYRAGLSARS
jgi:hypothetical protein